MLNKEICKKCLERTEYNTENESWELLLELVKNDFDKHWAQGGVICFESKNKFFSKGRKVEYNLKRNGFPPENCPYILEHVVNAK